MSFTNHNSTLNTYRKTNTGTNVAPKYSYILQESVSCTIDELSSRRVIRKEGDKILADHIIYIDYISNIEMKDVMEVGGDEFTIYRIHNPNRLNRHLEISCLKNEHGVVASDS